MKLSKYKDSFFFYTKQLKPYIWPLLLVLVCILCIELIATGLRYIFKIFIDISQTYTLGEIALDSYQSQIWVLLGVAFAAIAFHYGFIWLRYHVGNKVITSSSKSTKLQILKHLFTLDYQFFADTKSGSLITKFTRIERSMQSITESLLLSMFPAFFQLLISLIALFTMHYSYALLVIGALAISATYNVWLQRKQIVVQERVNDAEELENGLVSDTFTNVETVKLYAKEKDVQSRFEKRAETTRFEKLTWENYFRWFDSFNNSLPMLVMSGLLLASSMLLINKNVTIGDIFFAESTLFALLGYLRYVLWMFRSFYASLVDLDSIAKYVKQEPTIKDTKQSESVTIRKGNISFQNVGFSYQDEAWMNDLSLTISDGQSVALVGKSGSGKSTLVKLLCRFYDVSKGKILVDGHEIKSITQKSLRESLAFVAQEGILFDDTIYNNICFANKHASKKDVLAAVKAAQLDDVIAKLPDGLDTLVGERGVKLSGGERQRVSIARAILADRPIIVLDEATSALDSSTESKIQKALQKLLRKKTAIIIAHRLSTIMHVDNIVVMDKGSIVEQGTHTELLAKKGHYYNLWKLQKDGFIE